MAATETEQRVAKTHLGPNMLGTSELDFSQEIDSSVFSNTQFSGNGNASLLDQSAGGTIASDSAHQENPKFMFYIPGSEQESGILNGPASLQMANIMIQAGYPILPLPADRLMNGTDTKDVTNLSLPSGADLSSLTGDASLSNISAFSTLLSQFSASTLSDMDPNRNVNVSNASLSQPAGNNRQPAKTNINVQRNRRRLGAAQEELANEVGCDPKSHFIRRDPVYYEEITARAAAVYSSNLATLDHHLNGEKFTGVVSRGAASNTNNNMYAGRNGDTSSLLSSAKNAAALRPNPLNRGGAAIQKRTREIMGYYEANLWLNGRVITLGCFDTALEAAVAFDYAQTYLRPSLRSNTKRSVTINFPGSASDCRRYPPIDRWPESALAEFPNLPNYFPDGFVAYLQSVNSSLADHLDMPSPFNTGDNSHLLGGLTSLKQSDAASNAFPALQDNKQSALGATPQHTDANRASASSISSTTTTNNNNNSDSTTLAGATVSQAAANVLGASLSNSEELSNALQAVLGSGAAALNLDMVLPNVTVATATAPAATSSAAISGTTTGSSGAALNSGGNAADVASARSSHHDRPDFSGTEGASGVGTGTSSSALSSGGVGTSVSADGTTAAPAISADANTVADMTAGTNGDGTGAMHADAQQNISMMLPFGLPPLGFDPSMLNPFSNAMNFDPAVMNSLSEMGANLINPATIIEAGITPEQMYSMMEQAFYLVSAMTNANTSPQTVQSIMSAALNAMINTYVQMQNVKKFASDGALPAVPEGMDANALPQALDMSMQAAAAASGGLNMPIPMDFNALNVPGLNLTQINELVSLGLLPSMGNLGDMNGVQAMNNLPGLPNLSGDLPPGFTFPPIPNLPGLPTDAAAGLAGGIPNGMLNPNSSVPPNANSNRHLRKQPIMSLTTKDGRANFHDMRTTGDSASSSPSSASESARPRTSRSRNSSFSTSTSARNAASLHEQLPGAPAPFDLNASGASALNNAMNMNLMNFMQNYPNMQIPGMDFNLLGLPLPNMNLDPSTVLPNAGFPMDLNAGVTPDQLGTAANLNDFLPEALRKQLEDNLQSLQAQTQASEQSTSVAAMDPTLPAGSADPSVTSSAVSTGTSTGPVSSTVLSAATASTGSNVHGEIGPIAINATDAATAANAGALTLPTGEAVDIAGSLAMQQQLQQQQQAVVEANFANALPGGVDLMSQLQQFNQLAQFAQMNQFAPYNQLGDVAQLSQLGHLGQFPALNAFNLASFGQFNPLAPISLPEQDTVMSVDGQGDAVGPTQRKRSSPSDSEGSDSDGAATSKRVKTDAVSTPAAAPQSTATASEANPPTEQGPIVATTATPGAVSNVSSSINAVTNVPSAASVGESTTSTADVIQASVINANAASQLSGPTSDLAAAATLEQQLAMQKYFANMQAYMQSMLQPNVQTSAPGETLPGSMDLTQDKVASDALPNAANAVDGNLPAVGLDVVSQSMLANAAGLNPYMWDQNGLLLQQYLNMQQLFPNGAVNPDIANALGSLQQSTHHKADGTNILRFPDATTAANFASLDPMNPLYQSMMSLVNQNPDAIANSDVYPALANQMASADAASSMVVEAVNENAVAGAISTENPLETAAPTLSTNPLDQSLSAGPSVEMEQTAEDAQLSSNMDSMVSNANSAPYVRLTTSPDANSVASSNLNTPVNGSGRPTTVVNSPELNGTVAHSPSQASGATAEQALATSNAQNADPMHQNPLIPLAQNPDSLATFTDSNGFMPDMEAAFLSLANSDMSMNWLQSFFTEQQNAANADATYDIISGDMTAASPQSGSEGGNNAAPTGEAPK